MRVCAYVCVVLPMVYVCVAFSCNYEHMNAFLTFRVLNWFIDYMAIIAN